MTIGAGGSFDIVLTVNASAAGTLVNPSGICRVDPDGNVGEADEDNNDCSADTVEVTAWTVYLPLVLR